MTDITKHVTSLQLSRELKKAGVPQDSLLYWALQDSVKKWEVIEPWKISANMRTEVYSAFLDSELGEMLRKFIEQNKNIFILEKRERNRQLMYRIFKGWANDTEVEDRGKLLLYLIQEGLVDVKNLGKN